MSRDRFDVLERFAPMFESPEPSFEAFLRRRDRKRRNQRITAGAVGIAFFVAAAWIVTTGGPFDRTLTPTTTGPTIAPDVTGPVGIIGLPPESATPSSPSRGELVLGFTFGHTGGDPGRFSVFVYEDGRLIWQRLGGGADENAIEYSTGLLEQRLTPEGVELVRSEVLSTGLFDRDVHFTSLYGLRSGQVSVRTGDGLVRVSWGDIGLNDVTWETPTPEQASALQRLDARLADPASWLPASAWVDQEVKAYVASRYSLCFETRQDVGLDRVLASLPRRAEDLVRAWDLTYRDSAYPREPLYLWCTAITTADARVLAEILEDAGSRHNGGDVFGQVFIYGPRNPSALEVTIMFDPLLPHMP
jgi:hypothetical protein